MATASRKAAGSWGIFRRDQNDIANIKARAIGIKEPGEGADKPKPEADHFLGRDAPVGKAAAVPPDGRLKGYGALVRDSGSGRLSRIGFCVYERFRPEVDPDMPPIPLHFLSRPERSPAQLRAPIPLGCLPASVGSTDAMSTRLSGQLGDRWSGRVQGHSRLADFNSCIRVGGRSSA